MLKVGFQRQRALILALLISLLLWNLPLGGLLLYPFKLLATWIHEMSHGLLMLLTGVGFQYLEIFKDTSGIAQAQQHSAGPIARAFIHSAGYMGTSFFGALLLLFGQTKAQARSILAVLVSLLALSAIFWIRNDFGQIFAWSGVVIGIGIALLPSQGLAIFFVNFIAAQACINAILDIRVLFQSNMMVNGKIYGASDAHNMANVSFGNPWLWAGLWLLWSGACFYWSLRIIRLRHIANEERAVRTRAKEKIQDKPRKGQ